MDRRKVLLVVAVLVAAVGAALVFVYAQGAEDRAADKFQTQPVLVATADILPGERAADAASAGKLKSVEVPQDQLVTGSTNDGKLFEGTVALTTIYAGEQLLTQKFGDVGEVNVATALPIPPGKIAISLQMSDTGKVGPFTQPGSHVVVFVDGDAAATQGTQGTQGENDGPVVAQAEVLIKDLVVLAVGSQTIEGGTDAQGNPLPDASVALLTVAVSQKQASTLIGAQNSGRTLTFALRNEQSVIKGSDATSKNGTQGEN